MPNFLDIALKYNAAGYRVIPVDEQKSPAVASWREYMKGQSKDDVIRIFQKDSYGIAMIMGGGLEAIDIDQKYDLSGTLFSDYVKCLEDFGEDLVTDLVVQSTINGGFHLIFRCEEIGVNTKLALRPATEEELSEYNKKVDDYNQVLESDQQAGKRKSEVKRKHKTETGSLPFVLFETRGEGGYILVEPSPGYKIGGGKGIFDIPEISKEFRKNLMDAAKSFNEIYESPPKIEHKKENQENGFSGITPLDDYDQRGDVTGLLQSHGWTHIGSRKERMYFRRPGKEKGNSADFNTKLRLFKTWSTSTGLEDGKAYSPAALFCMLEHSGNFSNAAKELYAKGFGSRSNGKPNGVSGNILTPKEQDKKTDDLFEKLLNSRFDIHKKPKNVDVIFRVYSGHEVYDVGGLGMFGLIKGYAKARKTTLVSTIIGSAIDGGSPLMNMELKIGNKKIIHIDTEQSDYFYYNTQARTLTLGGKSDNHHQFYSYPMKGYSIDERILLIDRLIDHFDNIGVLALDGILDLCWNLNDEVKSAQTVQKILEWRDRSGAMILGIIHMGKGNTGYSIGHLGSFAERKCDFAIEINLDNDDGYSRVKPSLSRFRPFDGFDFTQDNAGIPVLRDSPMNILGQHERTNGHLFDDEERQKEVSNNTKIQRPENNGQENVPF